MTDDEIVDQPQQKQEKPSPNAVFSALVSSLGSQESSNNYSAANSRTGAAGKYQILPSNIGPWSQEILGRRISLDEYQSNPSLQEQIARGKLSQFYSEALGMTNDPYRAAGLVANKWYTGQYYPKNDGARPRPNEPSPSEYRYQLLSKMGFALGEDYADAAPMSFQSSEPQSTVTHVPTLEELRSGKINRPKTSPQPDKTYTAPSDTTTAAQLPQELNESTKNYLKSLTDGEPIPQITGPSSPQDNSLSSNPAPMTKNLLSLKQATAGVNQLNLSDDPNSEQSQFDRRMTAFQLVRNNIYPDQATAEKRLEGLSSKDLAQPGFAVPNDTTPDITKIREARDAQNERQNKLLSAFADMQSTTPLGALSKLASLSEVAKVFASSALETGNAFNIAQSIAPQGYSEIKQLFQPQTESGKTASEFVGGAGKTLLELYATGQALKPVMKSMTPQEQSSTLFGVQSVAANIAPLIKGEKSLEDVGKEAVQSATMGAVMPPIIEQVGQAAEGVTSNMAQGTLRQAATETALKVGGEGAALGALGVGQAELEHPGLSDEDRTKAFATMAAFSALGIGGKFKGALARNISEAANKYNPQDLDILSTYAKSPDVALSQMIDQIEGLKRETKSQTQIKQYDDFIADAQSKINEINVPRGTPEGISGSVPFEIASTVENAYGGRLKMALENHDLPAITNKIAEGLPDQLNNIIQESGANVKVDEVTTGKGGYYDPESGAQSTPNITVKFSGDEAAQRDLMSALNEAADQRNGILFRQPAEGEQGKPALVINVPKETSHETVDKLFNNLYNIKDNNGNDIYTGYTKSGNNIIISSEFYDGDFVKEFADHEPSVESAIRDAGIDPKYTITELGTERYDRPEDQGDQQKAQEEGSSLGGVSELRQLATQRLRDYNYRLLEELSRKPEPTVAVEPSAEPAPVNEEPLKGTPHEAAKPGKYQTDLPIVTRTIKSGKNKGKVVEGVIATDLTEDQVSAITLRRPVAEGDGFFIPKNRISRPEGFVEEKSNAVNQEQKQTSVPSELPGNDGLVQENGQDRQHDAEERGTRPEDSVSSVVREPGAQQVDQELRQEISDKLRKRDVWIGSEPVSKIYDYAIQHRISTIDESGGKLGFRKMLDRIIDAEYDRAVSASQPSTSLDAIPEKKKRSEFFPDFSKYSKEEAAAAFTEYRKTYDAITKGDEEAIGDRYDELHNELLSQIRNNKFNNSSTKIASRSDRESGAGSIYHQSAENAYYDILSNYVDARTKFFYFDENGERVYGDEFQNVKKTKAYKALTSVLGADYVLPILKQLHDLRDYTDFTRDQDKIATAEMRRNEYDRYEKSAIKSVAYNDFGTHMEGRGQYVTPIEILKERASSGQNLNGLSKGDRVYKYPDNTLSSIPVTGFIDDNPRVASLKNRIDKVKTKLANASVGNEPYYQTQIDALEKKLAKEPAYAVRETMVKNNRSAPTGSLHFDFENFVRVGEAHPLNKAYAGPEGDIKSAMPSDVVQLARDLGVMVESGKIRKARGFFQSDIEGNTRIKVDPRIFVDPIAAAKTIAHEFGHFVDYVGDIKTTARGNLVGHMLAVKDFKNASFGTLTNQSLRKELIGLSEWWKPMGDAAGNDKYVKYRQSAPELYADAISVMMNNPIAAAVKAPEFYKAFNEMLDKKPEVRKSWDALQSRITDPGSNDSWLKAITSPGYVNPGYEAARDKTRTEDVERHQREHPGVIQAARDLRDKLGVQFSDVFRDVKKYEKQGLSKSIGESATNILEELAFNNENARLHHDLVANVDVPLKEAGLSLDTLGEYMELLADSGARQGKLNPGFVTNVDAQSKLLKIRTELGQRKAEALQNISDYVHEQMFKAVSEAHDNGKIGDDLFYNTIEKNKDTYATFVPIEHSKSWVTSEMLEATGTEKAVANTYVKTVQKIMALNNSNKLQRAKQASLRVLNNYAAEKPIEYDLEKKPYYDQEKYGLLTLSDKGKRVGYLVDPSIAEAFNRQSVAQLDVVSRFFGLTNSKLSRPLMTTYALTFALWNNPIRDFLRTKGNLPGYNKPVLGGLELLKDYAFSLPEAVRYAAHKPDELLDSMIKSNAIDYYGNSYFFGDRADPQRDFLEHHGELTNRPTRYSQAKETIESSSLKNRPYLLPLKAVDALLKTTRGIGETIEISSKIVGYKRLREMGYSDRDAAYYVRNFVGTPNYRTKGKYTPYSNTFFMFSNIFLQGLKADMAAATNPTTRAGFAWKMTSDRILPKVFQWMATSGALTAIAQSIFGDNHDVTKAAKDLQNMYSQISEYDLLNYDVIPTGWSKDKDGNNNVNFIRIPVDESARFLAGLTWKMLDDGMVKKSLNADDMFSLVDYGAGQLPSLSPFVKNISEGLQFITGNNPYDFFRNRNVIDDVTFQSSDWQKKVGIMLDRVFLQNTGAASVLKIATPGKSGIVKQSNPAYSREEDLVRKQLKTERADRSLVNREALQTARDEKSPNAIINALATGQISKREALQDMMKAQRSGPENKYDAMSLPDLLRLRNTVSPINKPAIESAIAKRAGSFKTDRYSLQEVNRAFNPVR